MPSRSDRYRDQSVESRGAPEDGGSEASTPLMGAGDDGEKAFRGHGPDGDGQRRGLCPMAWSSWRWLLDTALLLVIVGLLLDRRRQDGKPAQFEGAGDLTGFAPRGTDPGIGRTRRPGLWLTGSSPPVAQQITTFEPDFSYAPENATDFFSPEVKQRWIDLVPSASRAGSARCGTRRGRREEC